MYGDHTAMCGRMSCGAKAVTCVRQKGRTGAQAGTRGLWTASAGRSAHSAVQRRFARGGGGEGEQQADRGHSVAPAVSVPRPAASSVMP